MGESIFLDEAENKRLRIQNELLAEYEQPIYREVIAGRTGLTLLDLGCNNGWKTRARFSQRNFRKVIGMDRLEESVREAEKAFGDGIFSFYTCDVEAADFSARLREVMREEGITGFDIIHCSFLLLHTKKPQEILDALRSFLAPEGKLILIEPADSSSFMTPDEEGLLRAFFTMLALDPYAGDRTLCDRLPMMLLESGYGEVRAECMEICATGKERAKKEAIFDTFCAYLSEDMLFLEKQGKRRAAKDWVRQNAARLRRRMTEEGTTVSMGVKLYICGGGGENA